MNNLSHAIILSNAWRNRSTAAATQGVAYAGAGLNGLLVLGSIYKLLRRSKGELYGSYIFVGLAGIFGLIGDIVFYTIYTQGKGFWAVKTIYYSLLRLFCLTTFIPLGGAIANREKSTASISRYFGYLAYIWAAITSIVSIILSTLRVNYGGYDRNGVGALYLYTRILLFCYFSSWGFVVIFFILFATFYTHLKGIGRASLSMFAFGAFATIPVLADTIVVLFL